MAKKPSKTRLRLGPRDVDVLRAVGDGRMLSTSQIASLLFPSVKKASARLKQLVDGGLLKSSRKGWSFARQSTENFYSLDKDGWEALRNSGGQDATVHSKTVTNIPHLAATNQFGVLLRRETTHRSGIEAHFLASWRLLPSLVSSGDDPRGKGLGRSLVSSIKPDAIMTLGNGDGATLLFFAEIDLDTEPISRRKRSSGSSLLGKIERYASYFDSGEYQRDGKQLFGHVFQGFRTILITTKDARLNRLRREVAQLGDTHFVWASTLDRVESTGILGHSWQVMASDDDGSYRSICDPYFHPHSHETGESTP